MTMINAGMHFTGKFYIEKGNKDGITETREFHNVVLNVGKVNMLNTFGVRPWPTYLFLGTGTTEPRPTDLGLQSVSPTLLGKSVVSVGYTQGANGGIINTAERVSTTTIAQVNYGEGEAEGTWTELGLGYDTTTYTKPFNRSLFRDESGVPLALTVLADEWLRVYIHLTAFFPIPSLKSGNYVLNGVEFPYTLVYSSLGWFHRAGFPTTVNTQDFGIGFASSIDTALKQLTGTFTRNPGATYTLSAIQFVMGNTGGAHLFRLELDPPIPKALEEQMIVTAGVRFFVSDSLMDGLATGGSLSTLQDTSKVWTVNEFAGDTIEIYAGTGAGQSRTVTSNTADTITVSVDWGTAPDATSVYEVRSV